MKETNTTKAGERTQFATGPWRVDSETPNHGPIITAEDGKGRDLAEIRGESRDERAATARLIAAAPELLEALKEVESHMSRYGSGDVMVHSRICAAINKAEGRPA